MKALIVDDNPSVIAILTEILKIDGHEVFQATNWEDAKRALETDRPDIMFLDSIVNQTSTIPFIDELDESINTRIVLILNGREQVPKDTSLIVRSIKKPFNSAEVLEAVKYVGGGCTVQGQAPAEAKRSRKFKFWIFGKDGSASEERTVSDDAVQQGKSYVVFEDVPEKIYELARKFPQQAGDLMIITGERKKVIETKIDDEHCRILQVSRGTRSSYADVRALGTIMAEVMEFINFQPKPVIIIDDLGMLISNNDLNSVITFIYQIYKGASNKFTLAVSVKESLLTEKDKLLLHRYMETYKPDEEESKETM